MSASVPELESVLRRFEEAAAPLLRKSLAGLEQTLDDVPQVHIRHLNALRQQRQENSKGWSKFLFEHAGDFNRIVRARPEFLPRAMGRRLPFSPPPFELPPFELPPFDRIRAEMIIVDRIFELRHVKPNPCLGTQPVIYVAPEEWLAGDTQTVTGQGFGPAAGTVVLQLDTPRGNAFPPPGTSIPLNVLNWSDVAARVAVPTALPAGIPLTAEGRLVLTRADVSCSDALRIVFRPPHVFVRAPSSVVAAAGTAPGSSYSRSHTFTSPILPPRAEPHVFGPRITPFGDVTLRFVSVEFSHGDDDPPSLTGPSEASFTSNRARTITLNVRDDWAWNYSLQVHFNAMQPADEVVGTGWSVTR